MPTKEQGKRNRRIGQKGEVLIAMRLQALGYNVVFTEDNAPYDFEAHGPAGLLFIEAKTSRGGYRSNKNEYRYQANIRNQAADVIIWLLLANGQEHYFIIPKTEIDQKILTISSKNPAKTRGKFKKFYNRWDYLQ